MTWLEYILLAATTWFAGFFPLAEIYVAVPIGIAAGLDPVSAVFWAALGNFTPVLLIHYGYEQLQRISWLRGWLVGLASAKLQASFNRWGYWFVLAITPWAGVWVTAASAKLLNMRPAPLLWATAKSIILYGIGTAFLVETGLAWWNA